EIRAIETEPRQNRNEVDGEHEDDWKIVERQLEDIQNKRENERGKERAREREKNAREKSKNRETMEAKIRLTIAPVHLLSVNLSLSLSLSCVVLPVSRKELCQFYYFRLLAIH